MYYAFVVRAVAALQHIFLPVPFKDVLKMWRECALLLTTKLHVFVFRKLRKLYIIVFRVC